MEGAQDMGGVAWSGPVVPEPDEPTFPLVAFDST